MRIGYWISGIGHGALIVWALFGGLFRSHDLPPPAVTNVSVISEADFAALNAPEAQPAQPSPDQSADPVPDSAPGQAQEQPAPAPDPQPAPEPQPQPDPAPPEPQPDPTPPQPRPDPQPPEPAPAPQPEPQPPAPDPGTPEATTPPDTRPVPKPVDRVEDTPTPAPPDQAQTAPEPTPEVTPTDTPTDQPKPPEEAAAPEESAPEIVTEAEKPTHAPDQSMRPKPRPDRPAPTPAPEQVADNTAPKPDAPKPDAPKPPAADKPKPPADTPKPPPKVSENAVNDALAEALGGDGGEGTAAETPPAPSGPPLTAGEKGDFALAVKQCWVVDPGSEAARITVDIGFEMTPDGNVVGNSLHMVRNSGGSDAAVKSAYEAGRRAILRCGAKGYDLPAEKYAQWREVEISFNPDKMRMK